MISAPAADAIPASDSVSAPIPPTGTSQSPVPLPITWYRKQRFWRSVVVDAREGPDQRVGGDDPALEVVLEVARSTSPSGRSTSASQAASSPTRARSASRESSGSVSVGKTAVATRPVSSENAAQSGAAAAPVRTSSPLPSWRGE